MYKAVLPVAHAPHAYRVLQVYVCKLKKSKPGKGAAAASGEGDEEEDPGDEDGGSQGNNNGEVTHPPGNEPGTTTAAAAEVQGAEATQAVAAQLDGLGIK
jgi:hypothetical protein